MLGLSLLFLILPCFRRQANPTTTERQQRTKQKKKKDGGPGVSGLVPCFLCCASTVVGSLSSLPYETAAPVAVAISPLSYCLLAPGYSHKHSHTGDWF